jgi:hypothetical protein
MIIRRLGHKIRHDEPFFIAVVNHFLVHLCVIKAL